MAEYFNIRRLFPVLRAKGWNEGLKFMEFWANGAAQSAYPDPEQNGKSTVGFNSDKGLRIYTVEWSWIEKFDYAMRKYNALVENPYIFSQNAINELKRTYGHRAGFDDVVALNDWLVDGLQPQAYVHKIKEHQIQRIDVNPYELSGNKLDDMVAAMNNFSFYVIYKGGIYYPKRDYMHSPLYPPPAEPPQWGPQMCDGTSFFSRVPLAAQRDVLQAAEQFNTRAVLYVTDVGVYAGDVYEFNDSQYLGTWDIINRDSSISYLDLLKNWNTDDTDDDEDVAVNNKTYRTYRERTGKGGDFLALSPIRLVRLPRPHVIPLLW